MASPGEDERLEPEFHDEEEGGPVKPFLEHLEDLRWVLIKAVVSVGVCMIICLIAANYVLDILTWPLERADQFRKSPGTELMLQMGTNVVVKATAPTNFFAGVTWSNQSRVVFELVPKQVGTDYVLTVQQITNAQRLAEIPARKTLLSTFGPVGGFWVAFQVALYGGIVLAAPYLIWVIGQFVLPALRIHEKKYVLRGFIIGTGLFMTGVAFCYFALMPMALRASYQYSEWLGFSADQWRAEDYISFVCKFMLGMGLGFELPVVVLTLVKIGVVDYRKLAAARRYMIVVNLFLGAILTTPEVVTQVLMFIPLQGLYELSVWIARYWEMDELQKKRALRKLIIVIIIVVLGMLAALWHWHPGFHAWASQYIR
jgi:sec-independent protein translocase protein TatC